MHNIYRKLVFSSNHTILVLDMLKNRLCRLSMKEFFTLSREPFISSIFRSSIFCSLSFYKRMHYCCKIDLCSFFEVFAYLRFLKYFKNGILKWIIEYGEYSLWWLYWPIWTIDIYFNSEFLLKIFQKIAIKRHFCKT